MASEYLQDLAFRQISQAIMATANSVSNSASGGEGNESSIFDVVRRKWGKVQDVVQSIAAPLKRRSMYDELPEHVWPREQIEMSHIVQRGRGHNFVPCQLSNPTWCDYCGDFIWGLYKQCLRCQTCQYTCHQHCVPAVTLHCKSITDDDTEIKTPKTPSPSNPRANLETSLSMGNIYARPGSARVVSNSGGGAATTDTTAAVMGQVPSPLSSPHSADVTRQGIGAPSAQRHHPQLSRSSSEGFVTAPASPYSPNSSSNISSPPQGQGHQHISPSCSPGRQNAAPSSSHSQTHQPHHAVSGVGDGSGGTNSSQVNNNSSSNTGDTTISNNNNNTSSLSSSGDHRNATAPQSSHPSEAHRQEGEANHDAATEKDETDSGYRSGTIPDDKLPRAHSQATLDRQELKRKIAKFNHFVPAACLEATGKDAFQGFLKVTMNLIRPITMELGARPPSIYELLTREHIVEENTQQVAFYMPRDTHKSLHFTSDTTTKEVVTSLLKKFHILDHPRKFAMYEQEFSNKNKLVRLRRLTDKDFPLRALLTWDPERIKNYRMVLQENETGEIVWDAFSLPELGNFLKVLDREEKETILELKHKYAYMKQYMERRIAELKNEKNKQAKQKK